MNSRLKPVLSEAEGPLQQIKIKSTKQALFSAYSASPRLKNGLFFALKT